MLNVHTAIVDSLLTVGPKGRALVDGEYSGRWSRAAHLDVVANATGGYDVVLRGEDKSIVGHGTTISFADAQARKAAHGAEALAAKAEGKDVDALKLPPVATEVWNDDTGEYRTFIIATFDATGEAGDDDAAKAEAARMAAEICVEQLTDFLANPDNMGFCERAEALGDEARRLILPLVALFASEKGTSADTKLRSGSFAEAKDEVQAKARKEIDTARAVIAKRAKVAAANADPASAAILAQVQALLAQIG
jgi:hypothetical protein